MATGYRRTRVSGINLPHEPPHPFGVNFIAFAIASVNSIEPQILNYLAVRARGGDLLYE